MVDVAISVFGYDRFSYRKIESSGTTLDICAANPLLQRYKRDQIYIGVNGRVIRDMALSQAAIQGYHRTIPSGLFPVCAVSIHLPPQLVDANIHPSKLEVRFQSADRLFNTVREGVENALKNFADATYRPAGEETATTSFRDSGSNISYKGFSGSRSEAYRPSGKMPIQSEIAPYLTSGRIHSGNPDLSEFMEPDSEIKVFGLLADTYILCEDKDKGLLIIDQHVAHERVLFEKYRKRQSTISSITLFEPLIFKASSDEIDFLTGISEEFNKFGYYYELFGRDIKITAVPGNMANKDILKEFRAIVELAMEHKRAKTEDIAIVTMSCRNAIKAGDSITRYEAQKLIDDLFLTDNPYTCPHGRPIIYSMTAAEIAKKFKR
jgi:DNA mismatch repair protein MutL